MNENTNTLIDLADTEARRRTFRKLLMLLLGGIGASVVGAMFETLPESIEMAIAFENEIIPTWRAWVALIVGGIAIGLMAWTLYDLWNFRTSGVTKFVWLSFFPFFVFQPVPTVGVPFSEYLSGLINMVNGTVLFMCWAYPDMFEPAVAVSASEPAFTPTPQAPVT